MPDFSPSWRARCSTSLLFPNCLVQLIFSSHFRAWISPPPKYGETPLYCHWSFLILGGQKYFLTMRGVLIPISWVMEGSSQCVVVFQWATSHCHSGGCCRPSDKSGFSDCLWGRPPGGRYLHPSVTVLNTTTSSSHLPSYWIFWIHFPALISFLVAVVEYIILNLESS